MLTFLNLCGVRGNWRKWPGSEVCPFYSSDKVACTLVRNEFMFVFFTMLPARALLSVSSRRLNATLKMKN